MTDLAGRRVGPPYVGRAEELARIIAALSAPPSVVVIEGEAGIGKTRLIAEVMGRLPGGHPRLAVGGCHRIRESFPLGPVLEAVRALREQLAGVPLSPVTGALRALLPELAEVLPAAPEKLDDRDAERHRVFRALVEVLDAAGPVALVLEDMHWADEQTTDFVGYLLAESHPHLSVMVTFRAEEVPHAVRALLAKLPAATSRTDVILRPLDERETGALAASIMDAEQVSDDFAAYLCERTSGVPFAIEELLALLRTRGTLARQGGAWVRRTLDELDVPVRIRDSVLERVSRLSGAARAVVEAAAVLQVPVPPPVLDATARLTPDERLPALQEALESGVLAEQGASIGFRHLLAAQAVYEDTPGPRRRDLHGRAAAAWESADPVPLGQVAHHLRHAGRMNEWVAAAERAADQAFTWGHDAEVVRLLEDVLRQAPVPPQTVGRLAVKLARSAVDALRTREASDLIAEVLHRDLPAPLRGELQLRLGLLLHEVGAESQHAHALMTTAVEQLTARPDLRTWAMVSLGIPFVEGVALAEHRRWLQRALDALPTVGDPVFEAFLLGKIAMVLTPIGDPAAQGLTEQIEKRAGGTPRYRSEINAYWSIGTQACYAGDHDASRRLLSGALKGAVAGENTRLELSVRSSLALLDFCSGHWDGLGERAEALVEKLADLPRAGTDAEAAAACLALAQGEVADAEQRLRRTADSARGFGGFDLLPLLAGALLRLGVARGRPDVADDAEWLFDTLEQKEVWAPGVRALPPIAQALVAAGAADRARSVLDRAASRLRELEVVLAPAALAHAHGHVAAGDGRLVAAGEHFAAAAGHYEALSCPYEAAQAREQAAVSWLAASAGATGGRGAADNRGAADGRDAAATLASALVAFRRLGATWDEARATKLARKHSVPVPARYRGGRRGYGSELSPREREVAELAAMGRTNKEIAADLFLSVNTVARHITFAMRKLQVSSRAGIANRLADRS